MYIIFLLYYKKNNVSEKIFDQQNMLPSLWTRAVSILFGCCKMWIYAKRKNILSRILILNLGLEQTFQLGMFILIIFLIFLGPLLQCLLFTAQHELQIAKIKWTILKWKTFGANGKEISCDLSSHSSGNHCFLWIIRSFMLPTAKDAFCHYTCH